MLVASFMPFLEVADSVEELFAAKVSELLPKK